MKAPFSKLVYLLFFLSGLAGLIYEIVWGRLLVLVFGGTTNSIVATVSAFLGGLALGGFLVGKLVDRLPPKQLLKTYSYLEFGVGITALLSSLLLPQTKLIYGQFTDGSSVTLSLLFIKFFLSSLLILVPTTLMGATLPFLAKFLQFHLELPDVVLSRLYAINTFGGMAGVLLAGFFLIEILGLSATIVFAACLNFFVAALAYLLPVSNIKTKTATQNNQPSLVFTHRAIAAFLGFGLSGLISISYQILWTRVLTPVMGTVIYAFSAILAIYLLGLALGSFIYPLFRRLISSPALAFGLLQLGIGLFAALSVLIAHKFVLPAPLELSLRVIPPTLLFGLTFPATLAVVNQPRALGQAIGISYATNTIGAIIGGYLASFFFIPFLGSSQSIVFLSLINFILAYLFIAFSRSQFKHFFSLTSATCLLLASYIFVAKNDRLLPYRLDYLIREAQLQNVPYLFREDEVATVYAKKESPHNEPLLIIDGVPTTHRVSLTKYMAHLPIYLHPDPHQVLIIAYGMGNTFRSSLAHGLITHAVELVPSVPLATNLFHVDLPLENKLGRVIINDGRNYAALTDQKYDIVIIDPPPPFNTASSTILHSKQYYQDLSAILNPSGIVNQWIYAYSSRQDDISMAIRTFLEVFPHVLAVQKADSPGGIFLLGSYTPLNSDLDALMKDPITLRDLQELGHKEFISADLKPLEIIGNRNSLLTVLAGFPLIDDTHPRTEYYLLRHRLTDSPSLTGEDLTNFVDLLKSSYRTSQAQADLP